jgi:phenylpropionate dioxygenase-like ring-hydroxylating dioxygenase large terminal subunit
MFYRYPFTAYPEGWFFVCHASELARGRLFWRQFHGEEIVAYRDQQGEVRVFDAYCPHLGAHLGKTGRLDAGMLKCQFHGFRFDSQGRCVRTGAGEPSRGLSLHSWRACESNGFVFAYQAGTHAVPTWSIPRLDTTGYNRLALRTLRVRSHPQEMAENSVDMAHFAQVHGFRELEVIEAMQWKGPHLTCAYRMRVPFRLLDTCGLAVRLEFRLQKWGLGYSLAEICWPELGLSARQFVFPTPLDGESVELNLALCVRRLDSASARSSRALSGLITGTARALLMSAFQSELQKDMVFWESKRYLARPAIDLSDGPIGEFRRFCRQFYPALAQVTPRQGASTI